MGTFNYDLVKDPTYFNDNRVAAHSDHKYYASVEAMEQEVDNFRCSLNEFRLIGIKLFKVFQLFAYIRHNDRSLENRLKNKKSTGNAVFTFKSCKKISLRSFGPFCPFPENAYILPQVFRVFNMFLRKISKKIQHRKAMNFEGNPF